MSDETTYVPKFGDFKTAMQIRLGNPGHLPLLRSTFARKEPATKKPSEVPQGAKSLSQYRRTCGASKCLTCSKPISQNKKYCSVHTPEGESNEAGEIDLLKRKVAEQTAGKQ